MCSLQYSHQPHSHTVLHPPGVCFTIFHEFYHLPPKKHQVYPQKKAAPKPGTTHPTQVVPAPGPGRTCRNCGWTHRSRTRRSGAPWRQWSVRRSGPGDSGDWDWSNVQKEWWNKGDILIVHHYFLYCFNGDCKGPYYIIAIVIRLFLLLLLPLWLIIRNLITMYIVILIWIKTTVYIYIYIVYILHHYCYIYKVYIYIWLYVCACY